MRIWMHALAALAAMIAAPAGAADAKLQRQVDAYVAPLVATRNFAGVVLVARGDMVVAQKAYGLASQELQAPNAVDGRFQVGSVSKPITAAAVLKLVQQGKLDLKAPISKVLPDYPNGENITSEMLLTHRAGLTDVNQLPTYADLGLKRRTPREIVAAFKDVKVQFAPGTSQAYSNSNYALLALVIETVAGRPYGDYVRDEVMAPLGMTRSGHRGDMNLILDGFTNGYVLEGRTGLAKPAWFDWSVKTGNGSIYATAGDLHRFLRGYFGGRLIRQDLLRQATAASTPDGSTAPGAGALAYGYGWFVDRPGNHRRVGHPGRSPGYTAQMDYYPDDQVSVIVLSNLYSSATTSIADAIGAMALGLPFKPANVSDAPVAPAVAAQVVGAYRFGPDFRAPNMTVMIVERDGRLTMTADSPFFPATALLPRGPMTYIDRNYWAGVTFTPGAGGKAESLTFASSGLSFVAKRLP